MAVKTPDSSVAAFADDEPQALADAIDEEYEEMGMRPFFDDEAVDSTGAIESSLIQLTRGAV